MCAWCGVRLQGMEVEEVGYFQGLTTSKIGYFEIDFLEVFNYNMSVLADVSSVCMHVCMYVCMYVCNDCLEVHVCTECQYIV